MKDQIIIDSVGRVVIPKPLRDRFRLGPGSRLDIGVTDNAIVLRPEGAVAALTEQGGLLVHDGEPTDDLISAVERTRRQRDEEIAGPLR
jgi:AbrB family looped-hinge helix DNA binding protein